MLTRREFVRAGAGLGIGALAVPLLDACSGVAGGGGTGGGGGKGGATIQIAWWGGSDRAKRTQDVMALFRKKFTKDKTSASFSDFNSYFQKLNTEAAGGGLPDVLQLGGGYVPQYMHKGQLLDLSKYIKGTIDVSDFDKGQLEQGQVDGKQYAVSIGGNMPGLMYNKTLIKKAGLQPPAEGISWNDFAAYAAQLARKLPHGVWPIDDASGGGVGDAFEVWTRQRHPESYTKDGKIAFTATDVQQWFQYWADLRKANLITPGNVVAAEVQNGAADAAPIVQGKAVFAFAWSNFLGQYQILTKDNIGIMRYPTGGNQPGDYVQASQFFSISAKSQAPQAAADFINFFVHDSAALKILGVERGVPASAKARDLVKPSLKPYDADQVAFLGQAGSQTRPKTQLDPSNSAAVGDALQRAAQSIPLAHASVNSAAKKFMSDAEKALTS